jgi:tRNA threonylcarbamoyladenosine biosynthesis protein TsaB
MESLQNLLDQHGATLIIDAASVRLQVGWATPSSEARWVSLESEAGTGLYQALAELDIDPNAAAAFVYCEGPGSMLGIRTVAAALRIWVALVPRPIWHYRSLELAAHVHSQPGATLICDARRQSWHALTLDTAGQPSEIRRLVAADLPQDSCYTLAGFRSWTPLPKPAPAELPYDATLLTGQLANTPLLRPTEAPDAYQPERPTYTKWEPRVHQAPAK